MNPLIIMFVMAPVHLWETSTRLPVPGWGSMAACEAAAPDFARRYGATNTHYEHGWLPWQEKKIEVFLPARVECVGFSNILPPSN